MPAAIHIIFIFKTSTLLLPDGEGTPGFKFVFEKKLNALMSLPYKKYAVSGEIYMSEIQLLADMHHSLKLKKAALWIFLNLC